MEDYVGSIAVLIILIGFGWFGFKEHKRAMKRIRSKDDIQRD